VPVTLSPWLPGSERGAANPCLPLARFSASLLTTSAVAEAMAFSCKTLDGNCILVCREWSGSRPQPCFLLPRWPHAAAQESSCPAARCTSTIALPRFSSALADATPEPKERSEAPGWVSNEQHVLYSVAPRDDICIFLSETAFSSSLRIELCRAVQKHTFQMLNS